MKTLLSGIICLLLSFTLNAQDNKTNDQLPEVTTLKVALASGNAFYLKNVKTFQTAKKINKLQRMAASYDIKSSEIYSSNKKLATYDVDFEESNCKITATYNSDGIIIKTTEYYNNMRLPHNLISEIAKNHPNWHFLDNTQLVNYNAKDGANKQFLVKIEKDGQQKTLKYKVSVTATNIDYIAMN